MTPQAALTKALGLLGGHKKMADKLGIKRTAIYQWSEVPPKRAVQIEEATNGEVTREHLRPDLFVRAAPRRRKAA